MTGKKGFAGLFCAMSAAVLVSCGQAVDEEERVLFRGGRDALCLVKKGEQTRGGLITYGKGDTNCTVTGPVTLGERQLQLVAKGDPGCVVDIRFDSNWALVGSKSAGCAYYCGPGADYSERTLRMRPKGRPATDFAGEPLC